MRDSSPRGRPAARTLRFALACLLFAAPPLAALAQAPLQPDVKPTCTVAPPTFGGWFKTGTVSLNGEVNPANSITFSPSSLCSFYQWSEQMFLWLTSPTPATYGGGGGRIFDSPVFYDVSGLDANGQRVYVPHRGLPRLLNVRSAQVGPNGLQVLIDARGKLFEVVPAPIGPTGKSLIRNSAGQLVEIQRIEQGPDRKLTFLDRNARRIAVPAKPALNMALAQRAAPHLLMQPKTALPKNLVQGFRNGPGGKVIFLDANGNQVTPTQGQAGDSGVLLAQNGSLVYYATMVNDVYAFFQTGTKNGAITPTPTQFPTTQAQLNKVTAYAATKGKTFPDPEALAIEAKTSWVETTGLDASKYVTATAVVPTYDQSNPLLWIPNGSKTVTLAMAGMHVVGSANGHPEMIWATFEHFGNTPWSTFTYTNTSNTTVTVTQAVSGTWLFSSTNNPAAAYNVERMAFNSPNIEANPSSTIGPSDTIRWKAWGSASNLNATPNNTDVMAINNSVIGQLAAGDVRANYMMTGSTWTIGGAAPTGANEVGTNQLANTTMETYQQGSGTTNNGTNCFSCHGSNQVGVSHIFNSLKPLFTFP